MEKAEDFLTELDNQFVIPLTKKEELKKKKEQAAEERENDRQQSRAEKLSKKAIASIPKISTDSDTQETRDLRVKLRQYQTLFEKETLPFFKTALGKKTNKNFQELTESIIEIEIILNAGTIGYENCVCDMITNAIAGLETKLKYTKYDISNLSTRLRKNPEFVSLSKRLFIKYGGNSFSAMPIEVQLCAIISIQAYLQYTENISNARTSEKIPFYAMKTSTPEADLV